MTKDSAQRDEKIQELRVASMEGDERWNEKWCTAPKSMKVSKEAWVGSLFFIARHARWGLPDPNC